MNFVKFNQLNTIIASAGILWFADDRIGIFDCGIDCPSRSQFEIVGD